MALLSKDVETIDFPLRVKRALGSSLVSAVVFPVALGLTHSVVLRPLKISTGSPKLLGIAAGVLTVSSASLLSSLAGIKSHVFIDEGETEKKSRELQISFTVWDLLCSAGVGVVVYRLLGGRFTSVLPSHYWTPGAFAREWIPAQFEVYANQSERQIIHEIGSKYGCHSCGKFVRKYLCDHQPPSSLLKRQMKHNRTPPNNTLWQKFYPHCETCSGKQYNSLSHVSSAKFSSLLHTSSAITIHSLYPRLYHVFLPVPLALTYYKYFTLRNVIQSQNPAPEPSADSEPINTLPQESPENSKQLPEGSRLSSIIPISDPASFPLFILWKNAVSFFDYFPAATSFHLTLWLFSIIAALGTI